MMMMIGMMGSDAQMLACVCVSAHRELTHSAALRGQRKSHLGIANLIHQLAEA